MNIAAGITHPRYNDVPPFHPGERFPELPFDDVCAGPNPAYTLVRQLWCNLGLDAAHFNTKQWNPLGEVIKPADTVLIKPNFVLSRNAGGGDLFAVITHPSVLRILVDYAYLALGGRGRIIIADAPDMACQWSVLMAAQRLETIQKWYQERFAFSVEVYDLRDFELRDPAVPGYSSNRVELPGDPAGQTLINLGSRSSFHGLPSDNYYGADYDRSETIRHHHDEVHEYSVSNTFLRADVILSAPKMKVHKKVGVTLNIKGLVGVNTNKNCLIHYRLGSPSRQGDQLPDGLAIEDRVHIGFQRWLWDHALARRTRAGDTAYAACRGLYRRLIKPFKPLSRKALTLDGGNWFGNDSAWRMTADLAKILFFADRHGILQTTPQRRIFCLVDGIIAGENEGPLAPTAKPCGCLVTGANPFAVDLVTTRLMGFDFQRLKQFSTLQQKGWDFGFSDPRKLNVLVNSKTVLAPEFFSPEWCSPLPRFEPHLGWRGHIELSPVPAGPIIYQPTEAHPPNRPTSPANESGR